MNEEERTTGQTAVPEPDAAPAEPSPETGKDGKSGFKLPNVPKVKLPKLPKREKGEKKPKPKESGLTIPQAFAEWVRNLRKMELPEKVNLPPIFGPIRKMNLPNQLTLLRIVLIPVFLLFLYWGFPGSRYVALCVFLIACLTDYFDGRIARKYHLITDFGKFADPLADKMLVTAAMLWFVETGLMPAWVLAIVILREFAVSGLRMVAAEKGRVIAAGWSGKVKTAATMVCVILMFFPLPEWLNLICVLVITLTTLYSGIEYFAKNRDVLKEA